MADVKQTETSIRNNPFWLDEVRRFVVLKFEMNQNNKDLYFWVVDKRSLKEELQDEDKEEIEIDEMDIEDDHLKKIDKDKIFGNELLVRIVGADYNDGGTLRKYVGGVLFYDYIDKKWALIARLNVLKYVQDQNKPSRRFRLTKPVSKVGMFDEVMGESPWDKKSEDFKPGLLAYHAESERSYKEYSGMMGAIILYSEPKIIQNEAIRYPVTYLNSLMEISFDLLHCQSSDSHITVQFVPKT